MDGYSSGAVGFLFCGEPDSGREGKKPVLHHEKYKIWNLPEHLRKNSGAFVSLYGGSRSSVRLQSALFRKCSGIWGPECKAAVTGGLQGQHLVRQHPGIYRDIGGHKGCGTVRIWDTSDGTVYFGGYGLSALPGGRHAVGTEFSVIYCHPGCRKEESV